MIHARVRCDANPSSVLARIRTRHCLTWRLGVDDSPLAYPSMANPHNPKRTHAWTAAKSAYEGPGAGVVEASLA